VLGADRFGRLLAPDEVGVVAGEHVGDDDPWVHDHHLFGYSCGENEWWAVANRPPYQALRAITPQTIGYALTDSPVGQLVWIITQWTDPATPVSDERMLTNISLYWLTGTAASSARLHHDAPRGQALPCQVPVGVAVLPHDITQLVRPLAERLYEHCQPRTPGAARSTVCSPSLSPAVPSWLWPRLDPVLNWDSVRSAARRPALMMRGRSVRDHFESHRSSGSTSTIVLSSRGGRVATRIDLAERISDRLLWLILTGVACLLLLLAFRSLLLPLKAAVMNLVSVRGLRRGGGGVPVGLRRVADRAGRASADRQLRADDPVRRPLRTVDGLRGVPAVVGAGTLVAHRGQPRGRAPRHGGDRWGDHVRRADHGVCLRELRAGRRPDGEDLRAGQSLLCVLDEPVPGSPFRHAAEAPR
jgi:hypothetical protein